MPAPHDGLKTIAHKWHDLAERRLAYYNELYRTGRWRHYFETQEQFAMRMLDVIKAAKTFAKAAGAATPGAEASAGPDSELRPAA
jgi:hypothetical protein